MSEVCRSTTYFNYLRLWGGMGGGSRVACMEWLICLPRKASAKGDAEGW